MQMHDGFSSDVGERPGAADPLHLSCDPHHQPSPDHGLEMQRLDQCRAHRKHV
jgi:hypothetical protein